MMIRDALADLPTGSGGFVKPVLGEVCCHWCDQKIDNVDTAVGQEFLTGVFGYVYCSVECMEDEMYSK